MGLLFSYIAYGKTDILPIPDYVYLISYDQNNPNTSSIDVIIAEPDDEGIYYIIVYYSLYYLDIIL